MKLTKNFDSDEFLPPYIASKLTNLEILELIYPTVYKGMQCLRDIYNKELVGTERNGKIVKRVIIQINTWKNGGDFCFRGLRPDNCKVGAKNSYHKGGPGRTKNICKAVDFDVIIEYEDGMREIIYSLEVQRFIKRPSVWGELRKFFTAMENGTIGWTHLDCRPAPLESYIEGPIMIAIPK